MFAHVINSRVAQKTGGGLCGSFLEKENEKGEREERLFLFDLMMMMTSGSVSSPTLAASWEAAPQQPLEAAAIPPFKLSVLTSSFVLKSFSIEFA